MTLIAPRNPTRAPEPPSLPSPTAAGSRLDAILDEFSERWEHGLEPRAEDYLDRLTDSDPEGLVELIYHEFCLAESSGRSPDPTDYVRRFPAQGARLGRLLGLHDAIDPGHLRLWTEPAELPAAGDVIGPYRLVRELGRGGFARVFLANQTDLADRPVVLKVSTRASGEPHLLARARHPHIVEVLRHAEADGGALQLVCMPFLGGATLADVLGEAWNQARRPRSGRALLAALDRVAAPEFPDSGAVGPARDLIARLSHAQAIAWIVARLADALGQAQRRGIAHGDLKPSNVLMAADGRPMLLDFNLAVDWRAEAIRRAGGGTIAYMAPERLRALADPEAAPPPSPAWRHRADLYALGLLLREALTGHVPEIPEQPGAGKAQVAAYLADARGRISGVRLAMHHAIPIGLRPIVARCLAPDPADRYAQAAQLAEDLDRWRTHRPLAFADEPAWPVCVVRWTRRQRKAVAAGLLVLTTGSLVAAGAAVHLQRNAREHAIARRDQIQGGLVPGVFRFRTVGHWQADEPDDPANAARHLALYGLAGPNAPVIVADWTARDDIRALPAADRDDLELWLIEQSWRLASRLSTTSDDPDDLRRALTTLERVPDWATLGPFLRLRCSIRDRLGLPAPTSTAAAKDGREPYALGLEAEPLHAREAFGHYRRVLFDRPESFWANYRAAAAAYRFGANREVADHLRRCLDHQPENPALHTQLGSSLYLLGDLDAARAEFEQALALDPDAREAIRGLLLVDIQLGQPRVFDADLERFSRLQGTTGRGAFLLRMQVGFTTPPPGFASRIDAPLPPFSEDVEILNLLAARLEQEQRTEEALAAYENVLGRDPDHLPARFRHAVLLRRLGRPEAASGFSALIDHPRFVELIGQNPTAIRSFHHLVDDQLHRGHPRQALATARRGLAVSERYREFVGDLAGESHYALARASAALVETDPRFLDDTVQALSDAAQAHPKFLNGWFVKDQVFDPIRNQIQDQLASPGPQNSSVSPP